MRAGPGPGSRHGPPRDERAHRPVFGDDGPGDDYHGYHFKVLKAQGPNARGGAYDYRIKGRMTAGFALVAWPARYGDTGVMSFIVSHDGQVYEKDLGPGTEAIARADALRSGRLVAEGDAVTPPRARAALLLVATLLAGCTMYQVAPATYAPAPPTAFERSWNAAAGALEDQAVQIPSEDRSSGVIRGRRGGIDVTANVRTQADGSVRVEFNTAGATGQDSQLINRISRSYDVRMGR